MRERRDSPGTRGEENKGKARKMCLTWHGQFFSQSCRLNARSRKAIGSREEPVGKMAAISLQPPVQVFLSPSPTYSSTPLSLSLCPSSARPVAGWLAYTRRKETPFPGTREGKGERNTLRRLLFLLTV